MVAQNARPRTIMAIAAASSHNPDPENGPAEAMQREFSRIPKEVLMERLCVEKREHFYTVGGNVSWSSH